MTRRGFDCAAALLLGAFVSVPAWANRGRTAANATAPESLPAVAGPLSPASARNPLSAAGAPSLSGGILNELPALPDPAHAPAAEAARARSAPGARNAEPARSNDDLALPRPVVPRSLAANGAAAAETVRPGESANPVRSEGRAVSRAPAFGNGTALDGPEAFDRIGVFFDGSRTRPNAENAADLPRAGANDDLRRTREWRLGIEAFERQAPVEELIAALDLEPDHRNWLTDTIFGDRLTGLKNALYLREKQEEIVRGSEAMITIKLDWLKEINDGVSHAAGDAFLKGFGIIGRKIVGREGVVIRRSPTGFAIFVRGDAGKARVIAEAVRLGVERELSSERALASELKSKEPVKTTISAGVAELLKDAIENGADNGGMTAQKAYAKAYRRAEEARQKAKDDAGGNRVAYHDGRAVRFDRQRTLEELREEMAGEKIEAWPRVRREITSMNLEPDRRGDAIPGRTIRDKVLYIAPNPELRETINALMRKIYNNHLSGLHNRRWLDDNLRETLDFFTEIHAIDIDNFGEVNKRVGEDEADRALRVLGRVLHDETEGEPALALHLSGEEFFLLTRMGPERALRFAHRVRKSVAARLGRETGLRDRETGTPVNPTVSIGIAPIPNAPEYAPETLRDRILNDSEEALKTSKRRGRNWVSAFEVPPGWLDRAVETASSLRERAARVPFVGPKLSAALRALGDALRALTGR